jgi:Zn-dependent M32 family carboxypeptidase
MRFRCAVLVILCLVCSAAQINAPMAARLADKEKQLEDLYADYWRTEYKIALGDQQLSSGPIQASIRAAVSDDSFLADLRAERFRDPLLRRRRDLFLEEATFTKISNDPKLITLVETITREENNILYEVNEKKLTRAELSDLVAHSADRNIREQAWKARGQITTQNGERIRQAMKLRNDLALRFTDTTFSIFMLRRKGVQTQELFSWFEQLRRETEPEYQQLLQQMRRELHVEKIEPWDLEYYFSILTNDFEQEHFAPPEGWPKTKQLAASLGYDLDKLPVEMRVADLSFAGAAYPIRYGKDVKVLANRYAGIRFYDRLLHSTGHALHYSMMNEPSFLLRANYVEPFDEGLAQVLTLMLYRPDVDTKLFGLSAGQAALMAERYRLKSLFDLRDTMADSLFEFEAYAEPDQDLSALYNRIYTEYLEVQMHGTPVWAYNPMYGSDPIYLQSFVVADMVARQIQHTVDKRFGTQWDKAAGDFMRDQFYSRGARQNLAEIMQTGTGERLTSKYLIEQLRGTGVSASRSDGRSHK